VVLGVAHKYEIFRKRMRARRLFKVEQKIVGAKVLASCDLDGLSF
jgi:hypothetical protein